MQDFYDPSRIDSMQEMFKTTAEHPSVIPLNGTKPIPGRFSHKSRHFQDNEISALKSEETLLFSETFKLQKDSLCNALFVFTC